MKQVMGCLVNAELTDILTAQLCSRSDVNTVIKTDVVEAMQLAQIVGNIDVFIVEGSANSDNFRQVKKIAQQGIVILGIGDPSAPYAPEFCYHPHEWEKLGAHLKKTLGEEKSTDVDYVSMPVNLFFHFEQLDVDVFLQMKKDGKPHWVRRFLAGEKIEPAEIKAYQAKGLAEFWLEKDKIKDFSKVLLDRLNKRARETLKGGMDQLQEAESVFTSLSEITKKMGVKGQMVGICEGWMGQLAKDCMSAQNSDVRDWWKRLSEDPSLSFQYRLVRLTTLLCTQHIMMTDWKSKEEQAQKLAGVAFFADMHLHNPDWVHLRKPEDLANLSADDKITVAGHASFAAQKLRDIPFVTKDIAILVAQHHGHQQGDWLPERVSVSVSPLALVYAACEEMAYACLKQPEMTPREIHTTLMTRHRDTGLRKHLEQMPAIFGW